MSYAQNRQTAEAKPVPEIKETTGAGPLSTVQQPVNASRYSARKVPLRARLEKVAYWILVAAAFVVILIALGFFLPKIAGGIVAGVYTGLFAGLLTLLNLPRPAGWGNVVLGRRVFPLLQAQASDIWRLAGWNSFLMFSFTLVFSFVASLLGSYFLSGLIVFGILIAAAIFYNRVRSVIIKP